MLRLGLASVLILMAGGRIAAEERFPGPVAAVVVDVLDGDTFSADALIWPGQRLRVNIRIRGIDAPEIHARCAGERSAAEQAKAALSTILASRAVEISNIGSAKYYGRVLADVSLPDGETVATAMLGRKLVRPYDGGKRQGWCG